MTMAWHLPATQKIGADQLSAVVRASPAALVCGLVNTAMVSVSFWPSVPRAALVVWIASTLALSVGIYWRSRQRRFTENRSISRRALRRAALLGVLSALPWAALPPMYLGHLPHTAELALITVCAGMAAGGSVLLAPVYPAAIAYVATILVPFAFKCFLLSQAGYALLGLLALSYGGFLVAVIAMTARLSIERTEALKGLRDRDAIISAQNIRFETALNNMTQGLCFFDGQERLIVCNQRYIELYGLDPERVRPGVSLSDIVDMRYEAKSCPFLSKDEYHAWRREVSSAGCATETIHNLQDGRIFAVHYRPMADGAWVATTDDITERQRLSEQLTENHKLLAHMATHDALTGLPNRVLFREQLTIALEAARAGKGRVAVLMLDLNKFKEVNDTLGHPAGDSVLKAAAERLSACVRDHDTVARLGGDEFAIVVHTSDAATEAAAIAARVMLAMTSPFALAEHAVRIGASIGIAVSSMGELDADQLVRQADVALYRAKAEGGQGYRFFEAHMDLRQSVVGRAS